MYAFYRILIGQLARDGRLVGDICYSGEVDRKNEMENEGDAGRESEGYTFVYQALFFWYHVCSRLHGLLIHSGRVNKRPIAAAIGTLRRPSIATGLCLFISLG